MSEASSPHDEQTEGLTRARARIPSLEVELGELGASDTRVEDAFLLDAPLATFLVDNEGRALRATVRGQDLVERSRAELHGLGQPLCQSPLRRHWQAPPDPVRPQ